MDWPAIIQAFRLDGRTVLVTGVGPGIGANVARGLAAAGANVVLVARREERLRALAAEINAAAPGRAACCPADIGDRDGIARALAAARDAFGQIDVLFHNAAFSTPSRACTLDCTDEDWDAAFRVNLLAPVRLARALVPGMRARGHGNIIFVLTTAAFNPQSPLGPYGATKAGLALLARQLAKECGPEVRVNAICPGTISADGAAIEAWTRHLERGNIPLKRIGLASEVVGAALFLASDASSYVTGQVLFVDGGRANTVA